MISSTVLSSSVTTDRDLAIDRFRGALVVLMVVGNYLGGVHSVPSFVKHAPDIGFTIADTVAPAFVFLIGVNFGPSFARRLRDGRAAAYRHFLMRYLSLVGIGAIISGGAYVAGKPSDWGVLQALGVAGLVALLLIELPTWARLLAGLTTLIGYQYVLDTSLLSSVLESSHGGPFGAVSWAALLVLSTAVADIWRRGMRQYLMCLGLAVGVAAVAAVIVPVSKNRVSLSFVLISLALSALVFLIVEVASHRSQMRAGVLCWWGEHSLAMYLLHLLVLALVVVPPIDWWYVDVSPWLAIAQLVGILTLMTSVAWWFSRRRRVSIPL